MLTSNGERVCIEQHISVAAVVARHEQQVAARVRPVQVARAPVHSYGGGPVRGLRGARAPRAPGRWLQAGAP